MPGGGGSGSAQAGEGSGSGCQASAHPSELLGPCPHRAGVAGGESEQRETQLGRLLPSLQLRQTPRALQNDEGIKPLFYLILWLRI